MTTIPEIIALCALNFAVDASDIVAERRSKHQTLARHTAFWLARKHTVASLPAIGKAFGGRDHTTIISGIERIEAQIETDPKLAALIRSLGQTLDFADAVRTQGSIDVLTVARRIARDPRRAAMAASTQEVAALAATVLDLWELLEAKDELTALLNAGLSPHAFSPLDDQRLQAIEDLKHNIETMERLIAGADEETL